MDSLTSMPATPPGGNGRHCTSDGGVPGADPLVAAIAPARPGASAAAAVVTFTVECDRVLNVVRQLAVLFHRHQVSLLSLSTWQSVHAGEREGIVVTVALPESVPVERLVKMMNRFIDVIRVRPGHCECTTCKEITAIDVVASGYFVDKVAVLGYEYGATLVVFDAHKIILRLSGTPERVTAFRRRLQSVGHGNAAGEIRISLNHVPAHGLLNRASQRALRRNQQHTTL